jgi:hypothetical protein
MITATSPISEGLRAGNDGIQAALYESGRGLDGIPRKSQTQLPAVRTGLTSTPNFRQYAGLLSVRPSPAATASPSPPILDGALYLTIAGGTPAWALASYSVSCNSPTLYLTAHAPGDEGGLDSADGVVNVHLVGAAATLNKLNDLCAGFTRQLTLPTRASPGPSRWAPLSAVYAIQGSLPLPAGLVQSGKPATVITFHYSPLLASSGTPAIVRIPLPPQSLAEWPPEACQLLPTSVDPIAGTVAVTVASPSIGTADGLYQAVLLQPNVTPPHSC